ncbi:hypothetical protein EDD11_002780 [Mortierella claussenii]|nr:hypothetical protein EDD11_002780 [Mortierella claussenii]
MTLAKRPLHHRILLQLCLLHYHQSVYQPICPQKKSAAASTTTPHSAHTEKRQLGASATISTAATSKSVTEKLIALSGNTKSTRSHGKYGRVWRLGDDIDVAMFPVSSQANIQLFNHIQDGLADHLRMTEHALRHETGYTEQRMLTKRVATINNERGHFHNLQNSLMHDPELQRSKIKEAYRVTKKLNHAWTTPDDHDLTISRANTSVAPSAVQGKAVTGSLVGFAVDNGVNPAQVVSKTGDRSLDGVKQVDSTNDKSKVPGATVSRRLGDADLGQGRSTKKSRTAGAVVPLSPDRRTNSSHASPNVFVVIKQESDAQESAIAKDAQTLPRPSTAKIADDNSHTRLQQSSASESPAKITVASQEPLHSLVGQTPGKPQEKDGGNTMCATTPDVVLDSLVELSDAGVACNDLGGMDISSLSPSISALSEVGPPIAAIAATSTSVRTVLPSVKATKATVSASTMDTIAPSRNEKSPHLPPSLLKAGSSQLLVPTTISIHSSTFHDATSQPTQPVHYLQFEQELAKMREEARQQRIRTDQLLELLHTEALQRREAEQQGSQMRQELQDTRLQLLRKELEARRSETIAMMHKAQLESREAAVAVAEAKEQYAKAVAEIMFLKTKLQEAEYKALHVADGSVNGHGGLSGATLTTLTTTTASTYASAFASAFLPVCAPASSEKDLRSSLEGKSR